MRRGTSGTLGRPVSEADDLPEPTPPPIARLRGKLQVTWATVRRYPSVVIVPLVIFSLIVGLGVFGVVAGMQRVVAVRQNDAWELASTTLTAFALTVQQSTTTVAAIGVYIQRNPIWPVFKAGFKDMTQSLLAASFQNEKIVQVEVSANGVLDAIYPNWVGGEGLDILNCCLADAMREVTAKVLKVDGPYLLQQGQLALIASMPVFVQSNVSSPATDPAWQLPKSAGNCSAPACYDPVTKLKWYGTVYSIMFLSELVLDPATKLPGLINAGWWFSLRRTDTVGGQTNLQSILASYGGQMSDPITASTVIGGTTYELLLAPCDGWQQDWWPAVIVAVVVIGLVISVLVFFTMMSKQQKSWLLYSILPRPVVQTLRRGRQWSQKSDCCVLFADVVGFTRITSTMAPEDIATMVGQLFCMYETMTSQHGLTKVDIIGDCFLAAAGMMTPETPEVCAVKAARLALDMVSACDGLVTRDGTPVQVRIGLHAGPVVSVVVGVQSPKLTVFGDVVNTCSRLQSTSLPACVQVSGIVAERLVAAGPEAKGMVLVPRGEVELKNRGVLSTWWVQRGTASGESSPTFSLGDPALQGGAMESNPQAGPFAYPSSYPALIGAERAGNPDWCDRVPDPDLPDGGGLATTITIRPEGLRSDPLPQMLLALGDANGSSNGPEPFDPLDADWRVPTGAPGSASISIPRRAIPSDSQPGDGTGAGLVARAMAGEMVGGLVGSGRPQGSGVSPVSGAAGAAGGLSGRVTGQSPPPSLLIPGSLPLDDVNLLPDIPESPFALQGGTDRGQAHRSPNRIAQASTGEGLPVALDGATSSSRDASPSIPLWDLVALSAASAGINPSGDRRSITTSASQKSSTRPRTSVSLVALANQSTVSQITTPGGSASRPRGPSSTSMLPPRLGGLGAERENSNGGAGTGSGGDSCRSSGASSPQAASPLWTTNRLGSETTGSGLQGIDALRTRLGQPGLQSRGGPVPASVLPAPGTHSGASASGAAAAGPTHRPPTRTQSTRAVQVQASGGSASATGMALGQSRSGSCTVPEDPEGVPRTSAPLPFPPSTFHGYHKVVLGQPLQASPTSLSYFPPEFHSLTAMTDRRSATGGRQRRTSQTSQLQLAQGSGHSSLRGSASVVNPGGAASFPDDGLSPTNQISSRAQTSGGQPRSLGFVDHTALAYQGQSTFSTTSYHHSSSNQQQGPLSSALLNSSGFADLDATRMSRNSGILGENRDGDVEEGARHTADKKKAKKEWSFRRMTPTGGKPAKAADPYWGQNLSTGMLQYTKQPAQVSAGGAEEASGAEAARKRSLENIRN